MRMRNAFFLVSVFSLWLISPSSYAMMLVIDAAAVAKLVDELNELKEQTDKLKDHSTYLQNALEQLSTYKWSSDDMLSLMDDLNTTMQQYSHIATSASNLDQQYKIYFPGYVSQSDYSTQYKNNVTETLNTINGSLHTIGMNTNDFSSETARLNSLHSHVQSAQGQTQAIQALSEVSEEMVTQSQSLRQIVSAQANSEAAYYAEQVQKDATVQANISNVINAGSTTLPVYGSNSDDCFN